MSSLMYNLLNKRLSERQRARSGFKEFIKYVKPSYDMTVFHTALADNLDYFYKTSSANSKNKMIFVPPQHGKSDQSSRLGPAYLLGENPKLKIAILSYSGTIAQGFSNDIQKIIESDSYRELYPNVVIDGVGCKHGTLKRNSYEFHTSEGGYVISVGVGGPLTSKTVDIAIIDDLYKSPVEAWSSLHRKKVEQWYSTVLETRLHNTSKILLLYTRWHHQDLAGKLLKEEPERWDKIVYELIKTDKDYNNFDDKRKIGEPLWPTMHSLEKSLRWKKRDPNSFEALGQQNPQPQEGYLYSTWFKTYSRAFLGELEERGTIKSYTDTADTGTDYLASLIFYEHEGKAYIKDLIYTTDSMEITIPLWSKTHAENCVLNAKIEYNNGGHPFKLYAVDKLVNIHKYRRCRVEGFHQTQNKEARILSQSAWVQENVLWPENWHIIWPEVYDHLKHYLREGKNEHDDIEDCLTGVAEMITLGNTKLKPVINPFGK